MFPIPVVIGVSCGGAFVLCLVAIFLIRQYKRRGERNPRHAMDSMPSEVAVPDAEKYELKGMKPPEDVVFFEEVGLSNKAAME